MPSLLVFLLACWPRGQQGREAPPYNPIQISGELARWSVSPQPPHATVPTAAAELKPSGDEHIFRSFYTFLFPTIPAAFHSSYALSESVVHLRAASVSGGFGAFFRQVAIGSVTEEYVQLHRSIPFFRNMLTPYFFGSFRHDGGGVILSGRFASPKVVRIYTLIGLSFVTFLELLALVGMLSGHATVWWAPFPCIGFFVLYVSSIKLGQWLARNDVAWLSRLISQALTSPT